VKTKKRKLVDFFLGLGVLLSIVLTSGVMLLEAAVVNQDDYIIFFLILHKINLVNNGVFLVTIKNDQIAFNQILETFSERYSNKKPGFDESILLRLSKKQISYY
jgi:hypothetical protein